MSDSAVEEKEKKSERTKHLLKSILGVDVDLIHSVYSAEKIRQNTEEWDRYMKQKGGLILFPDDIKKVGKEKKKKRKSSK
ncbi:MAG: hypothetical protein KAI64_00585 [Thermoplasmata archaeon]|nr:hypothetical protein [Thermoplasmata archaeon]